MNDPFQDLHIRDRGGGRGQGARRLWEAGEGRAGGSIHKVVELGEIGGVFVKLHTILQIEKPQIL